MDAKSLIADTKSLIADTCALWQFGATSGDLAHFQGNYFQITVWPQITPPISSRNSYISLYSTIRRLEICFGLVVRHVLICDGELGIGCDEFVDSERI